MKIDLILTLGTLLLLGTASARSAAAQMTNDSVKVGARVASFQLDPPKGSVTAAIVYDRDNPASEAEADLIEKTLESGLTVGAMRLVPRRVNADDLSGLAGARVAFVTKGINYRKVALAVDDRSIMTISSDLACARAAHCAVAITSGPKVQIYVSRAACRAARIRFSAAFLVLIKEL